MSKHTGIPKHTLFKDSMNVKPWVEKGRMMGFGVKMLQPCKFLDEGKCSIYEARPDACRIFPYNIIMDKVDLEVWPCAKDVRLSGAEKAIARGLMRASYRLRGATETMLPSLRDTKPYLKRVNEIRGEAIMNKMDLQLALYLGLQGVMKVVFDGVCKELEAMEDTK